MTKIGTLLGLAVLGGGVYYLISRKEEVAYPSDRPSQCRELYMAFANAANTYGDDSPQATDAYDAYLNCEERYG